MPRAAIGIPVRDSVRPRILLLGALAATAALLAACTTGPGPLAAGGDWGSECVPGALGHPVTDGMSLLDNTGTSPVTVTSVKLASPHGLKMTKAWLMPLYKSPRGGLDYAGVQSYPPTSWPEWPNRQPIPGAVIKPGQDLNFIFGLMRTAAGPGRTDGAVITYRANRTSYTQQVLFGFLITGWPSCPRLGP